MIVLKPGDFLTLKNIDFKDPFCLKYWIPGKLYIINKFGKVKPERVSTFTPDINHEDCCLELVKFWE